MAAVIMEAEARGGAFIYEIYSRAEDECGKEITVKWKLDTSLSLRLEWVVENVA